MQELIAREAENYKALLFIFQVQVFKAFVLRSKTALVGSVDNQHQLAFIFREGNILAFNIFHCEIIDTH